MASPVDVNELFLKKRFALGEISKDEFEEMKLALE